MRALHLIGLRTATGKKVRLYPADTFPLFLPSWLVESDREILLAFYQQILAEDTLRRVEVEWYRSIVDADREYLRNLRERHGSDEYLVVVKVRRPDVDLNDVLAQPELQGFQHVAIASDFPVANESLGKLGEITRLVQTTAEEIYEEMVRELGLRSDGIELVEPLVQTLLNPILVIETYNALLDVHAENVASENQRDAIYRRILGRLLDTMPGGEVVGLVVLALRGENGFAAAIEEPERTNVLASLRGRMLVRDRQIIRWARFLSEEFVRELLRERVQRLAYPKARPARGARRVMKWLDLAAQPVAEDRLRADVSAIFGWLNEGQLGRARTELQALESRLDEPGLTMLTRTYYWLAVARMLELEGRWADAEPVFREALRLQEEAGVDAALRGVTLGALARSLRDSGRWSGAEPLFREALRLQGEGGATAITRGIILHEFACGLRDNGRWTEAEPLFRETLRLKEKGGDTATSRGSTLHHLARGLRDNGRWVEAEPMFQEALRLKREGAASPKSQAMTLRAYARGLRAHGRHEEAAQFEAEADLLDEAGTRVVETSAQATARDAAGSDESGGD
ncbi:tetratricopeptide repeat protein [Polyangium jinanense]|uniref:Tetratricopeptide repeat protein n=1 Tax=Polyangium jinanense TaxID=2829994 RepID=A0A9X4AVK3_9BACT|nr:tetratricopeptide repeat protein [Polyangium jinanense]MDC3960095.1 tetratricopeptide repeat protein [Polyangium jinanense]MDC3984412.1 tetratricopeptide repeat protein [Polyangium jinanense]